MTKFEEMGQAADEAVSRWSEYQTACWNDMNNLIGGFVVYCGAPSGSFYFLRLDEESDETANYSLVGAMHYDHDGFWHLGFCLRLRPLKSVLMEICLTRSRGKSLVKTGKDGKAREIDLENKSKCEEFYEELIEDTKRFYTTEVQAALDNPAPARIGFV
jgi:hypothetical protein